MIQRAIIDSRCGASPRIPPHVASRYSRSEPAHPRGSCFAITVAGMAARNTFRIVAHKTWPRECPVTRSLAPASWLLSPSTMFCLRALSALLFVASALAVPRLSKGDRFTNWIVTASGPTSGSGQAIEQSNGAGASWNGGASGLTLGPQGTVGFRLAGQNNTAVLVKVCSHVLRMCAKAENNAHRTMPRTPSKACSRTGSHTQAGIVSSACANLRAVRLMTSQGRSTSGSPTTACGSSPTILHPRTPASSRKRGAASPSPQT
jgi:hypothetical protein